NTSYWGFFDYTSVDSGGVQHPAVEATKRLDTNASGFATTGPGSSLTNGFIKNLTSQSVTLFLYTNKNGTGTPVGSATAVLTIACA
ncbi:MAG: hypothetical protein QOG01_1445, partial [Pseudonocardiales bacterium]|nr:hypothetical protein [Pseudonocardiales bacterium]